MMARIFEGGELSADLGKTLEKFVTKLVASGRYRSKSEVLREGVRLIQERETRLAALDASIARGVADAGRVKSASEVFDKLESDLQSKARAPGGDCGRLG
jgi:antitoxin ParD1/3/4